MTDSISEPAIIVTEAVPTATICRVVPVAEIRNFFDGAYSSIAAVLAEQGQAPTGAAFARYHSEPTDVFDLEVGFPTAAAITASGDVAPSELPAVTAATATYRGSYEGLGEAWGALREWIVAHGRQPLGGLWEVYLTEPTPDMDPAELLTELFWSIAD